MMALYRGQAGMACAGERIRMLAEALDGAQALSTHEHLQPHCHVSCNRFFWRTLTFSRKILASRRPPLMRKVIMPLNPRVCLSMIS